MEQDSIICKATIQARLSVATLLFGIGGVILLIVSLSVPSVAVGVLIATVILAGIPQIVLIFRSKHCSLMLTEKGLTGSVSGSLNEFFGVRSLTIPIQKIDNISVTSGLSSLIEGGKTIEIRSASGLVKFPWVTNAEEFVNATLEQIEKSEAK